MATLVTLQDVIDSRDSRYDMNNVTFYALTDDKSLLIKDTDLFQIYRRYMLPYIGTYSVTKEQRRRYLTKPKLLSADVYGTPDLDWLILMINDQECASKFRMKSTVKLIPSDSLAELYDTIVTRSNMRLQENWNRYLPAIDQ